MAEAAGSGDTATINIKFTSSDKAAGQVSASLEASIGDLKNTIRSQFDMEPKRLIFQGRILNKDEQTLRECKLKDGLTVVVQAAPAASSTPPSAASAATPSPAAAAAARPAAAAQALPGGLGAGAGAFMGGMSAMHPIDQPLATVRGQPAGVARECLTTLTKVIDNIVQHPTEEKYRKIKRSNAGFLRKVGGVPGGESCMRALGFVEAEGEQSWLLTPSASAWDVLTAGRARIQRVLIALPAAGAGASARGVAGAGSSAGFAAGLGELPPPGAFPGGFGGGGGMGMGGGMGGGMPDMAMINQMAQNPAMLQGMMNDPSVQAMMRNNPQMGAAMQSVMANPALMSQAFSAMQNNPAMMQQAERMMQDPAALQQASQMSQANLLAALSGGAGAGSNATPSFPPPAAGFPAAPAPVAPPAAVAPAPAPEGEGNAGGGAEGQEEMTEDELVAEAIRRSMED